MVARRSLKRVRRQRRASDELRNEIPQAASWTGNGRMGIRHLKYDTASDTFRLGRFA
jgi:hypothetical protein